MYFFFFWAGCALCFVLALLTGPESGHRQPQWGGRRAGLYSGEAFFTVTAVADLPRRLECALIPSLQHSAAGGVGGTGGGEMGVGVGIWGF